MFSPPILAAIVLAVYNYEFKPVEFLVWVVILLLGIIGFFLTDWYNNTRNRKKQGDSEMEVNHPIMKEFFKDFKEMVRDVNHLKTSSEVTAIKITNTEKMTSEINKKFEKFSENIEERLGGLEIDHAAFHCKAHKGTQH